MYNAGTIPIKDILERTGISRATLYSYLSKNKDKAGGMIGTRLKVSLLAGVASSVCILLIGSNQNAADFYSGRIYPVVSGILSLISSPFSFSLQGCVILLIVLGILAMIADSIIHRRSWDNCTARCASILIWVLVWCYLGWGLNYSRSSIYSRAGIEKAAYDSTIFSDFLREYTKELNESYVVCMEIDPDEVELRIKSFYSREGGNLGLCKPKGYQHPKPMLFGFYQSWTGILGFIGPMFCESHLNPDLLPVEYPFTMAHEYSHLLGVSSEAEANWWAWQACRASESDAVRYSAYFSLLPHCIVNARRLLGKADYDLWIESVRPEILSNYKYEREYWQEKRLPLLDSIQSWIYDIFLKSNGIESGARNYSEVIEMIISLT